MVYVYPAKWNNFRGGFSAVRDNRSEGIYKSIIAATYEDLQKWTNFFNGMSLNPLHVSYHWMLTFLNDFYQKYQSGYISHIKWQVQSQTVEDSAQSFGQALAAMGGKDPHITSQSKLYSRIQFQFCCYSKQDLPPIQVKPTPIKFLRRIAIIYEASSDSLLQA